MDGKNGARTASRKSGKFEINTSVTGELPEKVSVIAGESVDPAPPLIVTPSPAGAEPPPPPVPPLPVEPRADAGLQSVTTAQLEQSKLIHPVFVPLAWPVNWPEVLMMTLLKSMYPRFSPQAEPESCPSLLFVILFPDGT